MPFTLAARRLLACLLILFATLPAHGASGDGQITLGIFPNLSARAIVVLYQPLHTHLEKSLAQPVQVFSAPDFRTFLERTLNREYDVVVMAPHLARLAQTEAGYLPLFSYTSELNALLVTTKNSPLQGVLDLRGKTIAMPDRLSLMAVLGARILRNAGMYEGDFHILNTGTHINSALAVQRGEAQAAIIGSMPWRQLSDDLRDSLRIVEKSESLPNQFILVSPNLPSRQVEAVRKALGSFASTPEGKRFLESNGFGGLRPASEAELRKTEPYARDAQALLKGGK